jgi:hypothetical protein
MTLEELKPMTIYYTPEDMALEELKVVTLD